MSVVLEFTVDADQFELGTALSGVPDTIFELERIIPTGDLAVPFLWVTTEAELDTVLERLETQLIDARVSKSL